MIFKMRLSKQKFVMTVRSYSGKTFFDLTVITVKFWFLHENLLVPIYTSTESLESVGAVVAEESLESDRHT